MSVFKLLSAFPPELLRGTSGTVFLVLPVQHLLLWLPSESHNRWVFLSVSFGCGIQPAPAYELSPLSSSFCLQTIFGGHKKCLSPQPPYVKACGGHSCIWHYFRRTSCLFFSMVLQGFVFSLVASCGERFTSLLRRLPLGRISVRSTTIFRELHTQEKGWEMFS